MIESLIGHFGHKTHQRIGSCPDNKAIYIQQMCIVTTVTCYPHTLDTFAHIKTVPVITRHC